MACLSGAVATLRRQLRSHSEELRDPGVVDTPAFAHPFVVRRRAGYSHRRIQCFSNATFARCQMRPGRRSATSGPPSA